MYIIKLETGCNIFRLKSAKIEVPSESGREFHNLVAKYEKEKLLSL